MEKAEKKHLVALKQNKIKLIYGINHEKPVAFSLPKNHDESILNYDFTNVSKLEFDNI